MVELRPRDLPLVGDHLGAEALADDVVLRHELRRERVAELLLRLHAGGERKIAHVLDARADHDVVDAGPDQCRAEVDGLLCRAALAVDRGGCGLDREALLQPGVAGDVEPLRTELLDAAGNDILHLGRVDPRALDHGPIARPEQRVRVCVLVVALLLVPAPDGRASCFDDDYLATVFHWT